MRITVGRLPACNGGDLESGILNLLQRSSAPQARRNLRRASSRRPASTKTETVDGPGIGAASGFAGWSSVVIVPMTAGAVGVVLNVNIRVLKASSRSVGMFRLEGAKALPVGSDRLIVIAARGTEGPDALTPPVE
jgi:hypothetical protein